MGQKQSCRAVIEDAGGGGAFVTIPFDRIRARREILEPGHQNRRSGTSPHQQIVQVQPSEGDTGRLLTVVDDLHWYVSRIGEECWDRQPGPNKWSFAQNLWYSSRQAQTLAGAGSAEPIPYLTDRGKECVGLAAEIFALFEYGESY